MWSTWFGIKPLLAETPFMLLSSVLWVVTALLTVLPAGQGSQHTCDEKCIAMVSQHTLSLLLLVTAGIGAFSLPLGTMHSDVESSRLHNSRSFVRNTIKTSLVLQLVISFCLWLILLVVPHLFSLPLLLSTHCVRLSILFESILRLLVLPIAHSGREQYEVTGTIDTFNSVVDSVRVSLFSPFLLAPLILSSAAVSTAALGVTFGAAWLCSCTLLLPFSRKRCSMRATATGPSSHELQTCAGMQRVFYVVSVRYNVHRLEAKHQATFKHHVDNPGKLFRVALAVLGLSVLSVGLSFLVLGVQHSFVQLTSSSHFSWFEQAYSQSWPLIVYCQGQLASSALLIALGIVLDTAFFRTMMLEVIHQRGNGTALLRWLSHECRSPVAAAMLALQELEESTLPNLVDSDTLHVSTAHDTGFRMNSDTIVKLGSHGLAETKNARKVLSEEVLIRQRVGVVADSQHSAAIQELRTNIKLVKQPVQNLSGVLDNMLVYLRRQREGFASHTQTAGDERLKLQAAWQTAWSSATANQDVPDAAVQSSDLRMRFLSSYHRAAATDSVWIGTQPVLRMLQSLHATSTVSQATVVQVLTNYLTNALKYGRGSDGTMRMDISFGLYTMPDKNSVSHGAVSIAPGTPPGTAAQPAATRQQVTEQRLHQQLNTALAISRAWMSATLRKHERSSGVRTESSLNGSFFRFSRSVNNNLNHQCVAGALQITVQDFGRGLDEFERDSLFQPFSRLRTSNDTVPGNGLGLWLMRQLVESQGGTVSAESTGHGQGSKFVLTIPISLRLNTDNKASVQSGRSAGVLSDSSAGSFASSTPRRNQRGSFEAPLRKTHSSIISVSISAPRSGLLRAASASSPQHKGGGMCKLSSPAMIQRHPTNPQGSQMEECSGVLLSAASLSVHGVRPVTEESADNIRLLIVDDAKTIRHLLKKQMTRLGFHVCTAEDGLDGSEQWRHAAQAGKRFHAVITDMTMPRWDGCKLCRHIREIEGASQDAAMRTIIIGVTGNVLPEDMQRFLDAGADSVQAKPLSGALLAEKLKKLGLTCG